VRVYVRTSVPLEHVASENLSHVVAHTSETMRGLAVVRVCLPDAGALRPQ
jgi:hypothetical protein